MSDRKNIEYIYKQNLEESIIEYLSEEKNIELRRQCIYITRVNWRSRLNRGLMV